MEERSVGVASIELSRKILIIFLFLGSAYSLPTSEERRQTLWRANKVRDTRVDDVIKDIKALVETEYLTLMERGETKNNNNNNKNNNNKNNNNNKDNNNNNNSNSSPSNSRHTLE